MARIGKRKESPTSNKSHMKTIKILMGGVRLCLLSVFECIEHSLIVRINYFHNFPFFYTYSCMSVSVLVSIRTSFLNICVCTTSSPSGWDILSHFHILSRVLVCVCLCLFVNVCYEFVSLICASRAWPVLVWLAVRVVMCS